MGITKSDLFSVHQNELAQSAKALAHPARIAILQILVKTKGCINSDLVQELGLAQPTISQHLRELKDIGIIQGAIEGTRMNYCINPQRWGEVEQQFQELFSGFKPASDSICC